MDEFRDRLDPVLGCARERTLGRRVSTGFCDGFGGAFVPGRSAAGLMVLTRLCLECLDRCIVLVWSCRGWLDLYSAACREGSL